jgi:N4-gp56 family major capsid protein
MQLDEWKDAHKYTDNTEIIEGLVGEWHGIYFVEYDLAVKKAGAGASAVDVYQNVILGKDAFGIPDIDGSSTPEMITKPIGSSGTADPLNQRGTVGWKAFLAAVILQPLAVQRYECTAGV